jgi:hypothetical protein
VTDRELLELAAKAAGMEIEWRKWVIDPKARTLGGCCFALVGTHTYWNPLTDDGDALRLAVAIGAHEGKCQVLINLDEVDSLGPTRAICLAIVRAAAEIGRNMT